MAAFIAGSEITEAVIDPAVVADMWTPISGMPNVPLTLIPPVARSPEEADGGGQHPSSRHPIIFARTVSPVTRRPNNPAQDKAVGRKLEEEAERWLSRPRHRDVGERGKQDLAPRNDYSSRAIARRSVVAGRGRPIARWRPVIFLRPRISFGRTTQRPNTSPNSGTRSRAFAAADNAADDGAYGRSFDATLQHCPGRRARPTSDAQRLSSPAKMRASVHISWNSSLNACNRISRSHQK